MTHFNQFVRQCDLWCSWRKYGFDERGKNKISFIDFNQRKYYFTAHPDSTSNEYRLYIFLFKFPYLESNNFPFWYLSHVITLRLTPTLTLSVQHLWSPRKPMQKLFIGSFILLFYFLKGKIFSHLGKIVNLCTHLIVIVQYMSLGPCISWSWNSLATKLFQEQERGVPSDLYRKYRTWNFNTML